MGTDNEKTVVMSKKLKQGNFTTSIVMHLTGAI